MGIEHKMFDNARTAIPVSATLIRQKPMSYWDYLPHTVKPYFVKKVCICGTESTGKSVLTKRMASCFDTTFVQEMAREIPKRSEDYTSDDLQEVARLHANEINSKINYANKILLCDTGLDTTKVYSSYFFGAIPRFESWIEEANKFDLYLYLSNDVDYTNDGTRLPYSKREELHHLQLEYFKAHHINIQIISGNWEERFLRSVEVTNKFLLSF